jgi:hypothetical protein
MTADPVHQITVSAPTFHALHLVARIDRLSPDAVVEQVMSTYLERRLEALRKAQDERARTERGRRVIDLAARRTAQPPTRSSRSTGARSRSSISSL